MTIELQKYIYIFTGADPEFGKGVHQGSSRYTVRWVWGPGSQKLKVVLIYMTKKFYVSVIHKINM